MSTKKTPISTPTAVKTPSPSPTKTPSKQEIITSTPLIKLSSDEYPFFFDDADWKGIKEAIDSSIKYLKIIGERGVFNFSNETYTSFELIESLKHFLILIESMGQDIEAFNERIKEDFSVYVATGEYGNEEVLYTGYYVPVVRGSIIKSKKYKYPIYMMPDDCLELNLGLFKKSLQGQRIVVRVEGDKVLPYYDHSEIGKGALKGRGLEIAWADDRVDIVFMQIQGSGIIELAEGGKIHVGFAGTNGRPYKAIGTILLKEDKINLGDMSMQAIKKYLKANPQDVERVLYYNPSYVFFRKTKNVTLGAMAKPLVDGRVIATDKKAFPQSALAYVETTRPLFDKDDEINGSTELKRFVLNQDTGGAIKGPLRADFFWGRGKSAELSAGHMRHRGKLYFLVKKKQM